MIIKIQPCHSLTFLHVKVSSESKKSKEETNMKEWKVTDKEQKVIAFPCKDTYDTYKEESQSQLSEPSESFPLPYGLIGFGGFFLTMFGYVLTGVEYAKLELAAALAAWLIGEAVAWGIGKLIYKLLHRNKKSSIVENSKSLAEDIPCQSKHRFSA